MSYRMGFASLVGLLEAHKLALARVRQWERDTRALVTGASVDEIVLVGACGGCGPNGGCDRRCSASPHSLIDFNPTSAVSQAPKPSPMLPDQGPPCYLWSNHAESSTKWPSASGEFTAGFPFCSWGVEACVRMRGERGRERRGAAAVASAAPPSIDSDSHLRSHIPRPTPHPSIPNLASATTPGSCVTLQLHPPKH